MTKLVTIVTGVKSSLTSANTIEVLDLGVAANVNGVGVGVCACIGQTRGPKAGDVASAAPRREMSQNSRVKSIASLQNIVGATILTSDRQVVGMVEAVHPASIGKFVATIRMNAAFGANAPVIQLTMQLPEGRTDRIRIGFTKRALLARIGH